MVITAVIDRIENGYVVLMPEDTGMEITLPEEILDGNYKKGEILTIIIDNL